MEPKGRCCSATDTDQQGHPKEINEIDYDFDVANRKQVLLTGKYLGASNWHATLHSLQVDNHLDLTDFGGLSGSPVFSIVDRLASASVTRFCGLAVQDSVQSGLVHFLEAGTIIAMLDIVIEAMAPRSWAIEKV